MGVLYIESIHSTDRDVMVSRFVNRKQAAINPSYGPVRDRQPCWG